MKSDISNIIKTISQHSNILVDGLDLCADKIQRFEAYIPGYCLYLGKQWENNLYIGNFLRSIDISNSDKLDVHAIVNVIFINKTISIVKVPTRLRASTFELTGIYFRGVYFRYYIILVTWAGKISALDQ